MKWKQLGSARPPEGLSAEQTLGATPEEKGRMLGPGEGRECGGREGSLGENRRNDQEEPR